MANETYAGAALTAEQAGNRALVRRWLYLVYFLLILLVFVGGVTRLTGSGLSITEWQPIHGVIPPLSQAEWQEEFAKYQQIAQYKEINPDMSLAGFKFIFWWEWSHRLLARFVFAIAVFLPLVYFWATKRLESKVKWGIFGIFLLGGLQGGVGWWMVHSGLGGSDLTSVSQYRLAAHFITACFIIIAVFALARRLAPADAPPAPRSVRRCACALLALALAQVYFGAVVAGLHAGKVYNTWPLMDGSLVPHGLFSAEPHWRNLFENPLTAQFIHRSLAYILLLASFVCAIIARMRCPRSPAAKWAAALCAVILAQAVFGIVTLLLFVPLFWALLHQIFALIVLSVSVGFWAAGKGALKPN